MLCPYRMPCPYWQEAVTIITTAIVTTAREDIILNTDVLDITSPFAIVDILIRNIITTAIITGITTTIKLITTEDIIPDTIVTTTAVMIPITNTTIKEFLENAKKAGFRPLGVKCEVSGSIIKDRKCCGLLFRSW